MYFAKALMFCLLTLLSSFMTSLLSSCNSKIGVKYQGSFTI
jgi:hypothetical protein